jgi:mannose-6-phosphate isomerase-like protein (cupin superfamily)
MTTEDKKVRIGHKVVRPWGYYKLIMHKKDYSVKLLHISPGEETSLQRHSKRHELVILLDGVVNITHRERNFTKDRSQQASSYRILAGEWHRFGAPTQQKGYTVLLEVAYGELDPDDFERKADKYNRERKLGPGFVKTAIRRDLD